MLENREGQRAPETVFRARRDGDWHDVSSQELFAGRRVAVFALPGAFTPTCSSSHLPRYAELAGRLREAGIDEIVCLSVNDGFVMEAWGRDQHASGVTLLPDGNGEFSAGMGMLVDKRDLGFGERSWRYSMVVDDGVIEKMFIEPDQPGDPFEVSDADTMLAYLDPNAERPHDVTVLSRPGCEFCARAKGLLRDAGIEFEELVLNRDYTDRTLRAVANATTYPQVFVDGNLVGGSDDLEAWLTSRSSKAA